jgi:hypothetical protein
MVILPHDFDAVADQTSVSEEVGEGTPEGDTPTVDGFYIFAQAENQDATLELQAGNPGEGDNLFKSETALTVNEGLNWYTITVTPADGTSPSKKYFIKVIKLTNLSLSEFKVKKDSDFELDLSLFVDTQDASVNNRAGLTIVATPADQKATVSPKSPISVPTLIENTKTATPVTVTVSRNDLNGVPEKYTSKTYVVNLYWVGDSVDLTHWATGGNTSIIPDEESGNFYEVHTFYASGSLSFTDTTKTGIQADYLIVAGGGGAGGNRPYNVADYGGGGGAGGLLYKAAVTLPLQGGSVTVTVGAGGAGGAGGPGGAGGESGARGITGGTSSIGTISVLGGGGGGGGRDNGDPANGANGGSGGGAAAKGGSDVGTPGNVINTNNDVLGNNGGNAGARSGGGGGGAGSKGGDASKDDNTSGAGGAGWQPSGDAAWITQITGTTEFSRGGKGGEYHEPVLTDGEVATNYGDGGSGRNSGSAQGRGGHDGIVIIRFLRQEE